MEDLIRALQACLSNTTHFAVHHICPALDKKASKQASSGKDDANGINSFKKQKQAVWVFWMFSLLRGRKWRKTQLTVLWDFHPLAFTRNTWRVYRKIWFPAPTFRAAKSTVWVGAGILHFHPPPPVILQQIYSLAYLCYFFTFLKCRQD